MPVKFEKKGFGFIHAQYDWTTGVLDNGNEWRKFRAVPRLYPLRSLVCTLFNKGGGRGAFRLPGTGGFHVHCTVEPSASHTLVIKIITCNFFVLENQLPENYNYNYMF